MKVKLLLISLLFCLNSFGQKLPITGLCLADVLAVIWVPPGSGVGAPTHPTCIDECFTYADPTYFDGAYAVAGGNWLDDFRNYGPSCTSTPTVSIISIADVTATTLTANGNVTDAGGGTCTVTARGICYTTEAREAVITDGNTSGGAGTGSFSAYVTGLTAGTGYNYRFYATNSYGTDYSTGGYFMTESTCTTRPTRLPCFALINQYYSGGSWHYLTGSEANACTALYEHVTNGAQLSGGAGYQSAKTQWSPIYYDCNATDCNVATNIPDGFYLIEHAILNDPIYQIISGVIVGITACPQ